MQETSRRLLSGWGRTARVAADLLPVTSPEEVEEVLAMAGRSGRNVAVRGLGRSYGDAAQCSGGLAVDTTTFEGVIDCDWTSGRVRVRAGTSLEKLMRWLVPNGWWVPVTPGTRHVTVGGSIAADVHGKNHHRDGAFCSHVESIKLATPVGTREVGPSTNPELFWATAGGMGLTGVILEATIRTVRIETSRMLVDTERTGDLHHTMARMTEQDPLYRYSVAWIDSMARGRNLGRAVVSWAEHAKRVDLATSDHDPLKFSPSELFDVPVVAPNGLLNPLTVKIFNEAWYRKATSRRRRQLLSISSYFHPLDWVGSWNRLYGPRGFLQYQFVVPFEAEETIREVLELLRTRKIVSFLAVLKRFGHRDPGPLSFPTDGWTLALDLPVGALSLGPALDEIDLIVARAGGRVYLAKDSRMRPELLAAMYPRLGEWRDVRDRLDPEGVMASDLGRRLGLSTTIDPRVEHSLVGAGL